MPSDNENHEEQEKAESISRRAIAKKVAYVVPVALAVISAAERPALAQSGGPPQ